MAITALIIGHFGTLFLALAGLQRGAGRPGRRQAVAAEGQLVALLRGVQARPGTGQADADLQDAGALQDLNGQGY